MKIYVIVYVSYDYYRFQENLFATTDLEAAREFAKDQAVRIANQQHESLLPLTEDKAESENFDTTERRHIYIESF